MKYLFKKLGLWILEGLRPLFKLLTEKKKNYFKNLRAAFTDPYLCGMIPRFSVIHEWIFKPYFEKVRTDSQELTQLKEISQKGTLVYVMKNRGQLEYSFFNHLFLKQQIPLAQFANSCRTLYWRPIKEIFRSLLARLDLYYQRGLLEDPIQSGYLENKISQGQSTLLNLKVSREFIFGASEDPLEFLPPLLRAAEASQKPVYLITQQFLYDRRPEKVRKSWVDFLFGEKSNPGMFRKLVMFVLSYRKKATIKFGEALDLQQFIRDNPGADQTELATKLKDILLTRLKIERKSITGPVLKPAERFLDKILRNQTFKETLKKISAETGKTTQELQKEASRYFREMAAKVNYSFVEFYDQIVRWMINNIYDGLDVDTEGLAKIKSVAGKHPVVLVPSHKSHIDYLLLSYLFYNFDLTLPHVCAGINLTFWPAGPIIRRGGGFFIRRSFSGNKLYKLTLEHYLKTLIRDGYATEFFIEGTRSRSGKLLKPRFGILTMLVKSWLEGASQDIYFVPISINYERILEEKSYVSETKGSPKQKENVTEVIKAHKKFRKKYGKVFIQFADPLSLKSYFKEKNIHPKEKTVEECRKEIQEFAYRITYNINKVSMVTATSLVASALLSYPKKGIPEKEVIKRSRLLKNYLEFKGANLSHLIQQREDWAYKEALQKLTQERIIESHQDFREKFYTIDESKRFTLDYHKNNAIHFFVSLVCLSKICQTASSAKLSFAEVEKRYESLKTLLQHDFTFSERASLKDHILRVIGFYEQENIITFDKTSEVISFNPQKKEMAFDQYASLLDTFFESYYLTLLYIKHISFTNEEKRKLQSFILEKGKALYLKGDLKYPEALSQFNIQNALLVFEDLGLIKSDDKGKITRTLDQESISQWEKILESLLGIKGSQEYKEELKQAFELEEPPSHTPKHPRLH